MSRASQTGVSKRGGKLVDGADLWARTFCSSITERIDSDSSAVNLQKIQIGKMEEMPSQFAMF